MFGIIVQMRAVAVADKEMSELGFLDWAGLGRALFQFFAKKSIYTYTRCHLLFVLVEHMVSNSQL